MAKRADPPRLNQEELEFINRLFAEADYAFELVPTGTSVALSSGAPSLLQLLQSAQSLQLEARFGHYTLQFTPRIESPPPDYRPAFQLGYPIIIEHNGRSRSHRVDTAGEEIRVIDDSGQLEDIRVSDISTTGIALTAGAVGRRLEPGKSRLRMRVRFPDKRWFRCEGSVVRMEHGDKRPRLALRFTRLTEQMRQELTSYLYHHSQDITGPP